MGRIGKRTITIPKGVEVKTEGNTVKVKGPKGQLAFDHDPVIKVVLEKEVVKTVYEGRARQALAMHGLYNSLLQNAIVGVTEGYEKRLEMVGVGYRAAKQGKNLQLQIGYSHPVIVEPPEGIEIAVEGTNKIVVKGIDKRIVGQIAAEIRKVRKVEPYKGKGIRYAGEHVRKKAGKAAKAATGA